MDLILVSVLLCKKPGKQQGGREIRLQAGEERRCEVDL